LLHFLTTFRRAVRAAVPVLEKWGALSWKAAADDLMAVFPTATDAVDAALALVRVDLRTNAAFCVGIGYGRLLCLDDDIFGDEVNVAFKLGEDIAGAGEVLVSAAAAAAAVEVPLDGPFSPVIGGVELQYFR